MTISIPATPAFVTSSFVLEYNTQLFTSPLTRQVQRRVLSGPRWVATYTLPHMHRENYSQWQAFFNKLQGRANVFNAVDPEGATPRGVATGTPLVNGADQTGSSIITDGWTPSTTGILKVGDYFSIGGELKIVTDDADSDGSGNATINFEPPIRTSPTDNLTVQVSNPSCEMVLTTDVVSIQTNELNVSLPISFSAAEVFS